MSTYFNQFLLNDPALDRHPRSWICIYGKDIKEVVSQIEKEVIEKRKTNREQLSKLIASRLNCNFVSIKRLLRGDIEFYPIPVILELCTLSEKEESHKRVVEESVGYLKVNSASSKPIKAVKNLSKDLARIIGAFCADGSLSIQFVISSKKKEELERIREISKIRKSSSRKEYYLSLSLNRKNYTLLSNFAKENTHFQTQTHYSIELTDEHKSNVEAFNDWIFNLFEVKPNSFYQRDLAWRTIFSNKILARYLISFFGFLPGYKCDIVSEPEVIKNSEFKVRKEFAKGAIMFDGCITKRKTISFSTISPSLANSIKDILEKDGLKVGSCINERKEYSVYTFANENTKKLLEYFEEGTKKWELLKWLTNRNFESKQITYEKDFKNSQNVYELIKEMKAADANAIKERFKCNFITARNHMIILRDKGKIRLSNKPKIIGQFVSEKSSVFLRQKAHDKVFNKLLEKFKTYAQASKFLEVSNSRLSSWKVRKIRIPLYHLINMCKILDVLPEEIYNNIEETDREIAEII